MGVSDGRERLGFVLFKKKKNVIVKPHPPAAPCRVPFGWFVLRVWFKSGEGGRGRAGDAGYSLVCV